MTSGDRVCRMSNTEKFDDCAGLLTTVLVGWPNLHWPIMLCERCVSARTLAEILKHVAESTPVTTERLERNTR